MIPAAAGVKAVMRAAWLGAMAYCPALELQRRTHALRAAGQIPDTLLLVEHGHVITRGRRGSATDVLAAPELLGNLGVDIVDTDRGGQTTYHGPGQLVGYPIVDLKAAGLGAVSYVRMLERTLIDTLGRYRVDAYQVEGQTGVWTRGGKIAAIGVRISSGVTMHGFALNVSTDLSFFGHIVPCGMPSAPAASIVSETGASPRLVEVASEWADLFGAVTGRELVRVDAARLGAP